MKKFKELKKEKVNIIEKEILNNWKKIDILNKTIDNRNNCKNFVFYDGPATANGMPGVHHMLAKLLKDTICKYKTMQGYIKVLMIQKLLIMLIWVSKYYLKMDLLESL